jgi:precorrin-6A synthase
MKTILIIGIGPGGPRQVTVEAIEALNRVDVFFVLEKGSLKRDMVALRLEILRRYIKDRPYRVVEAPSPPRTPPPANYLACDDDHNSD